MVDTETATVETRKEHAGQGLWSRAVELVSQNPLLFIIAFFIVFPFVVPYKALATQIIIWGLFALGYNVCLGYTGMLSFGHAAYFGVGAYTTGIVLIRLWENVWFGLLSGLIMGAVTAIILGYLCIKRRGIYFAMLTLAFAQLLYFIAFQWVDLTGGDNGLRNIPAVPLTLPGISIDIYPPLRFYFFVLFFVVLALLVLNRILQSPFGHVLQAVRENEPRARSCGYETSNVRWLAFILSGTISGLAGGLYALYLHFVGIESLYWITSGQVVMITLLGGMGSFIGPFIGAGVFLFLEDVLSALTANWMIFLGIIFVLCVLFFPSGVWGTIKELATRKRS
ncbi:MAG: branched-chain amino acid ABC transporter permease [Deltaproteobacteria bacterium]|nr:MAG: branched-chain amino acid ABC transporter permease [Deltaproteobacteria bacterium]